MNLGTEGIALLAKLATAFKPGASQVFSSRPETPSPPPGLESWDMIWNQPLACKGLAGGGLEVVLEIYGSLFASEAAIPNECPRAV